MLTPLLIITILKLRKLMQILNFTFFIKKKNIIINVKLKKITFIMTTITFIVFIIEIKSMISKIQNLHFYFN